MKKRLFSGIVAIFIIALFTFFSINLIKSNKKDEIKTIRLAEVTHSSFYTPLYVAIEKGYFKEEGIKIDLILTPGADKVSAAVLSNDVEIGFAGAESAIYIYNEKETDYPQIFCGLTKRDGQFIVAREKNKDFKLTDLIGQEILVGRKTGMPALNFINALKNADIDINKIKINSNVEFAALSGAFIGGVGDYVNLFEPNATKLVKEGYGNIVAGVGKLSGEVPYTTFYARKSFIKNNKDLIAGFTKAIAKGITYTLETDENQVAKDILKQFPDTKIADLASMIKNYKEYDCWLQTPFIDETLFTNLEDFLIDFKLIKEYVTYQDLVNNFYNEQDIRN